MKRGGAGKNSGDAAAAAQGRGDRGGGNAASVREGREHGGGLGRMLRIRRGGGRRRGHRNKPKQRRRRRVAGKARERRCSCGHAERDGQRERSWQTRLADTHTHTLAAVEPLAPQKEKKTEKGVFATVVVLYASELWR